MTSAKALTQARLFRFNVPGVEVVLAIPIEQLIGVARLPFLTPVPGMPPAILGLSRWQSTPVVVLDLRRFIDETALDGEQDFLAMHHVIIKVAIQNQINLVGCPILASSQMISVPLQLPRAELPPGLNSMIIHQAVSIDDVCVLLLNTTRLPDLIASLQPVL